MKKAILLFTLLISITIICYGYFNDGVSVSRDTDDYPFDTAASDLFYSGETTNYFIIADAGTNNDDWGTAGATTTLYSNQTTKIMSVHAQTWEPIVESESDYYTGNVFKVTVAAHASVTSGYGYVTASASAYVTWY
jgi:hypothetical protein